MPAVQLITVKSCCSNTVRDKQEAPLARPQNLKLNYLLSSLSLFQKYHEANKQKHDQETQIEMERE